MTSKILHNIRMPYFFTVNIYCHLVFALILLLEACKSNDGKIGDVLKQSGDNRTELEAVIRHYSNNKNDSLKLKAVNFLITNMPNHYSYRDEKLDQFNKIFDLISRREAVTPFLGNYVFPETDRMWDSITKTAGPLDIYSLSVISDCEIVSSKFLIENIDYAFMAWELPWARHLTFDEFCEYILPYRFQDEALESWRPTFWGKYSWLKDSMQGSTDPVKACGLINNDIKRWFRFNGLFNAYPSAISPNNLLKCRMGKCLDQAGIATFAMRAMGVPVVHEYVPQWADRSMGHDFSAVMTKDRKFIDFLGGELAPGKNEIRNKAPKIYRSTFSKRQNNFLSASNNFQNVPNVLASWHLEDVTKMYVSTVNIEVPISNQSSDSEEFLYLSVFNDRIWIPVAGSKISQKMAGFKDIGKEIVYLPSYFERGEVVAAGDPVLVRKDGALLALKANQRKKVSMRLNRKYPLMGYKFNWLLWMGKGTFQGANRPDFSDAVTLFVVPDTIQMIMHRSDVVHPGSYRYVRYLFPDNSSGSLSEISFYSDASDDFPLNGRRIKSPSVDSLDLEHAFDGKFETYIDRTPNNEYNGLWIGLDLGSRQRISSVGYSPRNDRNNVVKGMKYELFYWDRGWKSLGVKVAKVENELIYDNVPSGALYLLKNHTEGKEERIFTYSNGQQNWY